MPKTATKQTTKADLLSKGMEIMLEKGYNNTGIQEVLDACGVPKGSFYYYFQSKEEFALQIIDHWANEYGESLKRSLEDSSLEPLDRLKVYCETGTKTFAANQCRKGCLIGNLSQEMSDQSEVLRARLEEAMTRTRNLFAGCIKLAQQSGQVDPTLDHVQLAEFFLSGWHGALLRAKTTKTTAPQRAFIALVFDKVLIP